MVPSRLRAERLALEEPHDGERDRPTEVDAFLFCPHAAPPLVQAAEQRPNAAYGWAPDREHSVVHASADTWACVCCRCPGLGCSRAVDCCGFAVYRVSYTRAQWLWAFNFVCFDHHIFGSASLFVVMYTP